MHYLIIILPKFQVQIVFDHFKVRVNNSMVNSSVSALWKAYGWVAITQKQSFGAKVCFSVQA